MWPTAPKSPLNDKFPRDMFPEFRPKAIKITRNSFEFSNTNERKTFGLFSDDRCPGVRPHGAVKLVVGHEF